MSFEQRVESLIQEAMERGAFENLPGRGKRIDLDAYFETPADIRTALSVLKNAGVLPEEIELLHEIANLREILRTAEPPEERERLGRLLSEKQLKYNLLIERRRR